jgi:hypothetical protein
MVDELLLLLTYLIVVPPPTTINIAGLNLTIPTLLPSSLSRHTTPNSGHKSNRSSGKHSVHSVHSIRSGGGGSARGAPSSVRRVSKDSGRVVAFEKIAEDDAQTAILARLYTLASMSDECCSQVEEILRE